MTSVISIPLDQIDLGDRLRPINEAQAASRAESMAEQGQLQPIMVRPIGDRFVVVVGGHRFSAAKLLGWDSIRAEIRTDMSPLQARLAEIDENLERDELSPLDRVVFVTERKRVWEEMYPETGHGHAPKSRKSKEEVKSPEWRLNRYTLDTAEKTGISERVLQRVAYIGNHISPDLLPLVRQTYLAMHQGDLEKLARQPREVQLTALERLASGECKTLAGALGRTQRNDDEKTVQKWLKAWSHQMPANVRRRIILGIGVDPDEVERVVNPRGAKARAA